MAKRLSKALRGKRRWIGIGLAPEITSRKQAQEALMNAFEHIDAAEGIRLMDFHEATGEQAQASLAHLGLDHESGLSFAVLQVPHELSESVRVVLQSEDALMEHHVFSITSSGKIRLVRERMALARPPRR
tara:strand:- start:668 stop:1057 length:390 start_codon:yes stop_codon:yes gene_type:complete